MYALSVCPVLARQASAMLIPLKKGQVTCLSLLSELAAASCQSPVTAWSIPKSFNNDQKTPMNFGSPDLDYFRMPASAGLSYTSRWKEDWEELELLGKGAFGSVVKTRNKIDSRVYAVKKVLLRTMQSDKVFREVNALSRLSHRFIVRYYTSWVETAEPTSAVASDDSTVNSWTLFKR